MDPKAGSISGPQPDRRDFAQSFDRREILAGLAASSVLGVSVVSAKEGNKPDIRIIRDPRQPNHFGVGITLPNVDPNIAAQSYALFPKALASKSRPQGWQGSNKSIDHLDRFDFDGIEFSKGRGVYQLAFSYVESDRTIVARLTRNGIKTVATSTSVLIDDVLAGQAALVFEKFTGAEWLRWDLFGERLEITGDNAKLSLRLVPSKLKPVIAEWIEPELQLTLEPNDGGKIFAFEKSVSIGKLAIRRANGTDGEGARIQSDQENRDTPSPVWLGEAERDDFEWAARTGIYEIGRQASPRQNPAVRIVHAASPTRLTLRQWGSARGTLAVLRGPFTVTLLSPSMRKGEDLPPAVFPLSNAILTKQDTGGDPQPKKPGDVKGERLGEMIGGRLDDKAFTIETAFGAFIVEGDPPPVRVKTTPGPATKTNKGDALPRNPLGTPLKQEEEFSRALEKGLTQFRVTATGGEIDAFDARALLRQMSLALPNIRSDDKDSITEPGSVWSRLTFAGTEIAFRLYRPVANDTWPSARGVVTLGQMPKDLAKLVGKDVPLGRDDPPQVCIALDGARLDARRDSDNLALTFAFARMALELGAGGGRIVPNQKLTGAGAGDGAARPFDDRALLIVHFPPQHVGEKVYARQINDGTVLPPMPSAIVLSEKDVKGSEDLARGLSDWRKTGKDRKRLFDEEVAKLRTIEAASDTDELKQIVKDSGLSELLDLRNDAGDETLWKQALNTLPNAQLDALVRRWKALPLDQRAFYLGGSALALDPDARKVWLDIWRAYLKIHPKTPPRNTTPYEERVKQLPDIDLTKVERDAITERLAKDKDKDWALAEFMCRRSPDFALVSALYDGPLKDDNGNPVVRPDDLSKFYQRQQFLRKFDPPGPPDDWKRFVSALLKAYQHETQKDEFLAVTPARLSGVSRLVFRFDTAGGSADALDQGERSNVGEATERARAIPFSLVGLTDWGRFDLAVTRRAETLELKPGGRIPNPALRGFDLDPMRNLLHKGIRPGASIAARLADIVASLQPPGDNETAIELPFRMQLSPDQFGRFRTRRTIDKGVLGSSGNDGAALTVPPMLWSANLEIGETTPALRAVWSEDFVPSAIVGLSHPPKRGPWAPWQVPPEKPENRVQFRTAMDAYDRHEIVGLTSVYGLPVMGRRNELYNLTDASQFEPPKAYRLNGLREYDGPKPDLSAIYNPASLAVSELRLTALGGSLRHDSAFIPPAAAVRESDGSALFSAFAIERWRQITVLGRDIEVEIVYKGFLFPLGVRAALIKLTERRFVRNPMNGAVTAFLIQRKFIRIGKPVKTFPAIGQANGGRRFPVSELTMLTRETPDLVDPDLKISSQEIDVGGIKVSLTANGRIESDYIADAFKDDRGLCFWPRTQPGVEGNIAFEFKLDDDTTPLRMALVFVDNRAANNPDVVAALAAYYNLDGKAGQPGGGNEALRRVKMNGARRRYADENQDGECHHETYEWHLRAEGREPRPSASPVEGSIVSGTSTNSFYESDPLLQGSDQPPFYPYIDRANLRFGQIERFVGSALPARDVQFEESYRIGGFPRTTIEPDEKRLFFERYLRIEDGEKIPLSLKMGDNGDRSGGIGRPAIDVVYLSRRFGPMPAGDPSRFLFPDKKQIVTPQQAVVTPPASGGGDVAKPELSPTPFKLADFFGDDAKLLGLISFKDLLSLAGCAMPDMKEQVDAATEETADVLRQTVLPEIDRSLKSLETMWQNAQSVLMSQAAATRDVVSLDIDKIYPDIGPVLKELTLAVERAQQTDSILDLITAMSQVQSLGRRFATAVGRTLADPVAPLREEIRGKFRFISQQIAQFDEGLSAFVQAALQELVATIKNGLKKSVLDAIDKPPADVVRTIRLLLALPIPDTSPPTDDQIRAASSSVDAAIAAGVRAFVETMLDAIGSNKSLDAVLIEARVKALEAARDDLKSATDVLAESYHNRTDAFLKEYNAAAEIQKPRLLKQVQGPLYPVLFGDQGLVKALVDEWQGLQTDLKSNPSKALPMMGKHVGELLTHVAEHFVQAKLQKVCNDAAEKLADATTKLLPSLESGTGALKPLIEALDDLQKDVLPSTPPVKSLYTDAVVIRYRALRDRLTPSQFAALCTGTDSSVLAAEAVKLSHELLRLKEALFDRILSIVNDVLAKLTATSTSQTTQLARDVAKALADVIETTTKSAIASLDKFVGALPQPGGGGTPAERAVQAVLEQFRQSARTIRILLEASVKDASSIREIGKDSARDAQAIVKDIIFILGDGRKLVKAQGDIDDQMQNLLSRILMAREEGEKTAIAIVGQVLRPAFVLIEAGIYKPLDAIRTDGKNALAAAGDNAAATIFERILRTLRGPNGEALTDIFSVPPVVQDKTDAFDAERRRIGQLAAGEPKDYLDNLTALAESWSSDKAAPLVMLRNLATVLTAVLRGDLAQFVDLQQIRREIDAAIRQMVPARIKRSFDLKLSLGDIGKLVKFSDPPRPHPIGGAGALVLRATGVVDLLDPSKSRYEAEGYMPGFTLNLLPPFDVVTLGFQPATFTAGLGKPFHVAMKIDDVKLGSKVSFLQKLGPVLGAPKDGSGFFLRIMTGRGGLGLTAGYALPIPAITIGNMFIDNLALSAAAELPFDSGDARFVVSVSRPEAPFMIAVAPYAGAGHFGLIANTQGVVGFEASFQYGGGGGFSFGPLTGKGRISVGVFVRNIEGATELYGLFYAGGSAQIACFSCGAQLNVRLQQDKGNLSGEAIFTFSFSLGIKDIEFSVTVFKKEPGSGEEPKKTDASPAESGGVTLDLEPHEYGVFRNAFAGEAKVTQAQLVNETRCKGDNYGIYRSYFSRVAAPGTPPPKTSKQKSATTPVMPWVMS